MAIRNVRRPRRATPGEKTGIDKQLLFLSVVFTILGFVAIADASAPLALRTFDDSFYFVRQQIVWGVIGMGVMVAGTIIHYSVWKKFAFVIFGVSIVFLILVLLPGFGVKLLGARRWLSFGILSFQPSEVVKLAIIIVMARLLDEQNRRFYWYLVPVGIVAGLIMLQPDLGTTIVVVGVAVVQLFVSGVRLIYLVGSVGLAGLLGVLLIAFSGYRRDRLIGFFKVMSEGGEASYHVRQILLALGSGGLFGVGLGQSRQKYLFLPEVATDSVFAVIAEEVGFVGAVGIIITLAYFVFRIVKISYQAPDRFSGILAAGVAAWIGGQAFLNISSMVALTPLTGIPLPFFSYGGSSLVMILFGVGILLNISRHGVKTK